MQERDQAFFDRADALIKLVNGQMEKGADAGQVSASFMYSLARYNAWFSASGWRSGKDLAKVREETIDLFVSEYRRLLEMNLDDYITHFEQYIPVTDNNQNGL